MEGGAEGRDAGRYRVEAVRTGNRTKGCTLAVSFMPEQVLQPHGAEWWAVRAVRAGCAVWGSTGRYRAVRSGAGWHGTVRGRYGAVAGGTRADGQQNGAAYVGGTWF